jgi:16S rRNA (cytosine1402-N4)-methyltransferase
LAEVDKCLALGSGEVFCDCTLGGGGHSVYVGRHLGADGLLIGIDRDAEALSAAAIRLAESLPGLKAAVMHGNFADLDDLLLDVPIPGVDAFLFDLGVSSHQLDSPDRGFAYSHDAPLDMRMDPGNQTLTAAEVVNHYNEASLTRILHTYGEERFAHRIARQIVIRRQNTPYATTGQLVETIRQAIPQAARRKGGNPAKRSFQAIRIAVNSELTALSEGLAAAMRWLNPGGRIVVLTYHSLEDRIVKQLFAEATTGCTCPADAPVCVCGRQSVFEVLGQKVVRPSAEEIAANPRSSSAKLRAVSKRAEI